MQAIDLRSDTVTRPSPAMREAMASAPVGDDVYGEDPTINRLEAMAAERVGKPAAVFVASGTMANQLAVRTHTQPGDAMYAGRMTHIELFEGGGAAAISGVQSVLIGERGFFEADQLVAALHPRDDHFSKPRLVCVENTHNQSGGRVFPLAAQQAISAAAHERGLSMHLDGARIFNAAVASGDSPEMLAAPFDSVSFCLSKGLGAPVGSLLCGDEGFVAEARRFRKMFGGGMRQAGILAAAGVHALEHHVDRLATDHANARRLAEGLAEIEGVRRVSEPETNLVRFEVDEPALFLERASKHGVLTGGQGGRWIRAVTHRDVSADDIESALGRLRESAAQD
jgi:threonine aldolase